MGGQQFCSGGTLVDTRRLDRVLAIDEERGTIEVEAGIRWPALIDALASTPWAIRQKQTGADDLAIGGAVSANVHGRGLTLRPFVDDLEQLVIVDAAGEVRTCSRTENADLFALAVGGYGLFGAVYSATLRLERRTTLERVVELAEVDGLDDAFAARIAGGFTYGDFQFAVDPASRDFLRRGVFSCYRPVEGVEPPAGQRALSQEQWQALLHLAHTDKSRAFEFYARHYLATSGQLYLSDRHQLAQYAGGYHDEVGPGSEMISELYVPRDGLADFMRAAAEHLRRLEADVIYGTIRLIERDDESLLAWAREPWACVIFNLHVEHTRSGIEFAAYAFRRLIDLALAEGGSFYLTYHRWATRAQLDAAHPRLGEFLGRKLARDPAERFQSEWYRHMKRLYAAQVQAA
jgi:FAD/FMN-containing dehydrogenase